MMVDYKQFDMRRVILEKLFDPVYYDTLVAQIQAIRLENDTRYHAALDTYRQCLRLAGDVWKVGSKEWKYIRHADVPKPPTFKTELKRLERQRDLSIKHQHERLYRAGYKERFKEAYDDLINAGFQEFLDFKPTQAIIERRRLMELDGGEWVRKPLEVELA